MVSDGTLSLSQCPLSVCCVRVAVMSAVCLCVVAVVTITTAAAWTPLWSPPPCAGLAGSVLGVERVRAAGKQKHTQFIIISTIDQPASVSYY